VSLSGTTLNKVNARVNKLMKPWLESPRCSRLISGQIALISYTGRRSGKTFTTPVGYKRKGDEVTIAVAAPDSKSWWRNFQGDGALMQLKLKTGRHHGHATASRDAKGRMSVKVQLTD
jgi:hypothetical protein